MPIYKGAKQITKVYQGEQEIDKVYRGASKVYGADKGTEITVSGNPLVLTNVAKESALDTLEINGRTEQTQLQGYNIWDKTWLYSRELAGVVLTNNGDGSYTLNGTATRSFNFEETRTLSAGTYTLKANANKIVNSVAACVQIYSLSQSNGATVTNPNAINRSVTTTFKNDVTDLLVRIRCENGVTYDNFIVKPQLEVGSVAHSYEPYCGGIPSPNPAYPQEIVNVNSLEVVQSGANLFPYKAIDFGINTHYENRTSATVIDDFVRLERINMSSANDTAFGIRYPYCFLPPNSKVYVSFDYRTNRSDNLFQRGIPSTTQDARRGAYRTVLCGYEQEGYSILKLGTYTSAYNNAIDDQQWHTFTFEFNTWEEERYALNLGGNVPNFPLMEGYYFDIRNIRINTVATDYEPYKPIHIASIDGIELTQVDKIVKRDGVWGISKWSKTKRILSSDIAYISASYNNSERSAILLSKSTCFPLLDNNFSEKNRFSYCNMLTKSVSGSLWSNMSQKNMYCLQVNASCGGCIALDNELIGLTDYTNTTAIRTAYSNFFDNNNVVIVGQMPTEQSFIPLSQTIQDQLNALQIYKPTTIVSNNAECEMSAKYLCYLDNAEAMLTNLYNNDLSEVLK